MERKEVFNKMEKIFSEVLDLDSVTLQDCTSSEDVEGWDSLAHVQLISKIQSVFGIKFSAKEMIGWDNVGEIVDSIMQKI